MAGTLLGPGEAGRAGPAELPARRLAPARGPEAPRRPELARCSLARRAPPGRAARRLASRRMAGAGAGPSGPARRGHGGIRALPEALAARAGNAPVDELQRAAAASRQGRG